MLPSRVLRQAAAGPYKPLIKFLGRRTPPKAPDHTPHAHPAAPTDQLPSSFATYRANAQQHGPLAGQQVTRIPKSSGASSKHALGYIGAHSGHDLGSVAPPQGVAWDRDELPQRFARLSWSASDMEVIESGGASEW